MIKSQESNLGVAAEAEIDVELEYKGGMHKIGDGGGSHGGMQEIFCIL